MKFLVCMTSKDNHKFEFTTFAESEKEAKENANEKISDLGWEHHSYKIKSVSKINVQDYKGIQTI